MSALAEAFRAGGMAMWPTLVLGLVALVLSARHALSPKPELMPIIVGTGIATVLSGGLGMVTGLMATFGGFQPATTVSVPIIAMTGVSESLNSIALALAATTIASLLSGIGSFRAHPIRVRAA